VHDIRETRIYQEALKEGKEEGLKEGKEKGKEEGLKEGIEQEKLQAQTCPSRLARGEADPKAGR
jgi:predicted transposase YdaD